MSACAFPNPCGMEICAFKHYITCRLVCSATLTAKHAGNTHGFFSVADTKIRRAKRMFFAIKRYEFRALGLSLYDDMMAFNHVGIKAVHGLPISHHNIISDVYNVIDRAQADGAQLVLQPFRTFFHLAICNRHTGVTFASILIFDGYCYGQIVIVNNKGIAAWTFQCSFITILHQPSVQVACHAIMT